VIDLIVSPEVFVHLVHNLALFFGTLLLFILVSCRGKFDLYVLSFSSAGSTLNSSKISSFFCDQKRVYLAVLLKTFISTDVNRFLSSFLRVQISFPHKRIGTASALYSFITENLRNLY